MFPHLLPTYFPFALLPSLYELLASDPIERKRDEAREARGGEWSDLRLMVLQSVIFAMMCVCLEEGINGGLRKKEEINTWRQICK